MSGADGAARHRRAKELFLELMELPEAAWRGRLAELCSGDAALAAEVESLLRNREVDTDQVAPRIEQLAGEVPGEVSRALREGLWSETVPGDAESAARVVGAELAGRYTLEERLGAGGMGEVWRARDRVLAETVALKFVRSQGAAHAQRLLNEAAVARRVSHRNVCRVYDATQVGEQVFLSMQYVAGPDLADVLRRDGAFDAGPARRLAVELIDALAVVHGMGLLHRDLKPANILFEEDGRALVSDFGLAIPAEVVGRADAGSGTRLYMAPEQLQGAAPSVASDVFALGLVLYEAVTGRRAFRSPAETVAAARAEALPPRPSVWAPGIDAVLEHIILRCLAPDAAARPDVVELRRALAEDDPLAAVLVLGDTPSAAILAVARSRPPLGRAGVRRLLWAALLTVLVTFAAKRAHGVHLLPERSPAQLAAQVRKMLVEFAGVHDGVRFERFGYAQDIPGHARSGHALIDRPGDQPSGHHFWYRAAQEPLWPRLATSQLFGFGRVRAFDPRPGEPGATTVLLDRSGQLVFLDVWPGPGSLDRAGPVLDWEAVFARAGLRLEDYVATEPLPPRAAQADRQHAWVDGDGLLRAEAATRSGRLVAFELLEQEGLRPGPGGTSGLVLLLNALLLAGLFVAAMPRALRHFRSGRGDLRVSLRVASLMALTLLGAWLLYADHPGGGAERFSFVVAGVMAAVAGGFLTWILSVAIEPGVQRDWPRTFVTWSRFFRGHLHGAGVHGDVLTGLVLGLSVPCLQALLGAAAQDPADLSPALRGFGWPLWAGTILEGASAALLLCLEIVALLSVFSWLLRGNRRGVVATWLLGCLLAMGSSASLGASLVAVSSLSLILFGLLRYGLLAAMALACVLRWFENTPLAPGFGDWYAPYGLATLGLVVMLLGWAAWPQLRGRTAASAAAR